MSDLWQDLRYSARALLKQRGFVALVVLTLALGIGINTAVFSVVDAVLFRPLPFASPHRLVEIWEQESGSNFSFDSLRVDQIETWRGQTQVFDRVETYTQRDFTMTGGLEPEGVHAAAVSPTLFATLGVAPQLGRPFSEGDAIVGNDRLVLLSDTFWRTRFGGSPDVIGKTTLLSDQPYTVVGVMPPKFKFPYRTSTFWVPLTPAPVEPGKRSARLPVLARLRDGLSLVTAQTVLDSLKPRLLKERPDLTWGVKLVSLDSHRVNPRPRQTLLVLMGAVGLVLLLACANAANLLLARAAGRQSDIAIRLAIGASRARIVRQLLAEGLILASLGGILGSLVAWIGVGTLARLVPDELTFLTIAKIDMDPRVLLFALAVTLITGVGFALVPALRTSRPNLQSTLGSASGKSTSDRSHNRLRDALVVVEVALSLVLLIGAGLMIRSFLTLSSAKPGFDPTNLVAVDLTLPEHRYQTRELQRQFFDRLTPLLDATPGVESVTLAGGVPPSGGGFGFDLDVEIEGRPPLAKDQGLILPFNTVDQHYFSTLRIPILRGRAFRAEDGTDAQPLMIINQEMARNYWPNEDPLGQRVRFSRDAKWKLIVGVAENVGAGKPGSGFSQMTVYYPSSQETRRHGQRTLIVRTSAESTPMIALIRGLIRSVDKDQPIQRIDTGQTLLDEALAEPRFYLRILSVFAVLTLLLVSMGIYGVMSHAVAQRTREIGIRQAVGARRQDILGLVVRRGMGLTLAGIIVGVAAAASASRVMATFLFGLPATDPQTYALVSVLMTAVALGAAWIPARRATRVDPLVALRQE